MQAQKSRLADGVDWNLNKPPEQANVLYDRKWTCITVEDLQSLAFPEAVARGDINRVEVCGGFRLDAHFTFCKYATVHEFFDALYARYNAIPDEDKYPCFLEGWHEESQRNGDAQLYRLTTGS